MYGADYVKAATYSIPNAMLKTVISEQVEISDFLMDQRRYSFTQKALHLAATRQSGDDA